MAKRIVVWGTFDGGNARLRTLLGGLEECGVTLLRCHEDIWGGVRDKSQLGLSGLPRFALRALVVYPRLLWRYLRLPRQDAVLVGYPGFLDILLLRPLAWLRGEPVVLDQFLSLYNTVVEDRAMVARHGLAARLVFAFEWLVCRSATQLIVDTAAHARYFTESYGLPPGRCGVVWVGADPQAFPPLGPLPAVSQTPQVLFYGKFIPLHGMETIIAAARLLKHEAVKWVIIGSGQTSGSVQALLDEEPLPNLQWIPWVPLAELKDHIGAAQVCLGIFGTSAKAARVIPNKVFEILACGRPLITCDTPAIRELLDGGEPGVTLVPSGDAEALAAAIRRQVEQTPALAGQTLHDGIRPRFAPRALGKAFLQLLDRTSA